MARLGSALLDVRNREDYIPARQGEEEANTERWEGSGSAHCSRKALTIQVELVIEKLNSTKKKKGKETDNLMIHSPRERKPERDLVTWI